MDEVGRVRMSGEGVRLFEELMRFRPDGLTANGWAVKAGVSRTIWSDLRRHGNPSRRTMEKLLGAAGMTLAEFEALRVEPAIPSAAAEALLADPSRDWRPAQLAPIPLVEDRLAGEWDESGSGIPLHSIDRPRTAGKVDRPASLAGDSCAYALTMAGGAMWPRFRAGRRLLVSPAAAVEAGDDVLVELTGGRALIGELVDRPSGLIELRQFNPDAIFRVDAGQVLAVHKIVGEAI